MTGIYLDETARLKTYTAVTRGTKATIKIEIETSDRYGLASVLRQLDEIDREQREAAKRTPNVSRPTAKSVQLSLPAPLLKLQDHREGDT